MEEHIRLEVLRIGKVKMECVLHSPFGLLN